MPLNGQSRLEGRYRPVVCVLCRVEVHTGCDWPSGCECCHPVCLARLSEETP